MNHHIVPCYYLLLSLRSIYSLHNTSSFNTQFIFKNYHKYFRIYQTIYLQGLFPVDWTCPDKCSCMKRNIGIIPNIIKPGNNHCSSCRRRVFFIGKRVFHNSSIVSYVPRTRIIVDDTIEYPYAMPYYFVRIWRNDYGSMNIAYLK